MQLHINYYLIVCLIFLYHLRSHDQPIPRHLDCPSASDFKDLLLPNPTISKPYTRKYDQMLLESSITCQHKIRNLTQNIIQCMLAICTLVDFNMGRYCSAVITVISKQESSTLTLSFPHGVCMFSLPVFSGYSVLLPQSKNM